MSSKPDTRTSRKSTNSLVALGSVAVLSVYTAGYVHTAAAAARFGETVAARRPTATIARVAETRVAETPAVETPTTSSAPTPALLEREAPTSARNEALAPPASRPSASVDSSKNLHSSLHTPVLETPTTSKPLASSAVSVPSSPIASTPRTDSSSAAKPSTPVADSAANAATAAAIANAATAAAAATAQHVAMKDGTYTGWGTSRHGDVEATIEIKAGKIISASISQCRTEYSCSWIAALPPQVIARQSAEVDYVSGATQSTNAFYSAVVEALKQAK